IAVGNNGNVYVTGYTWNGGSNDNYTTIKYSPTADTLWVRNYNGPGDGLDQANALAIDNSGNVYVTGTSRGVGTNRDYATIKYSSIGDTLWVRRYDGPAGGNDDASFAVALDDSGNVYVTGYSRGVGTNRDYTTFKYNSIGDTVWVRRYNGPGNGVDEAIALKVDSIRNVYVTGYSTGSGTGLDYATIKRNSMGDTVWVRRYNGPGNGDDSAQATLVDNSGNVYVTGSSVGSGTGYDYTTIKYNSIGDTLWLRRYNGAGNGADLAQSLALDVLGNVYVSGFSWNGNSLDYLTIKYNSIGDTVWTRSFNGTGNGEDVALAVSVDKFLNVYVSGYSWNGGSYDYVTLKYIQNRAPILDSVGAQNVAEGNNLTFRISSSDVDGDSLILTAVNLPANATFFDSGNGAGSFSFNPSFVQAGIYNVTFRASDGSLLDSEVVQITVTEAGNQAPVLDSIGPKTVVEGSNLTFRVHGIDPDGDSLILTIVNAPTNSNFLDSGNGAGSFSFNPSFVQAGIYNVTFRASDGSLLDSEVVQITVTEAGNQAPVLDSVGSKNVAEGSNLTFRVHASDADGDSLILTVPNLPANAIFIDSGNGAGSFSFNPNFSQAGLYSVTFKTTDGVVTDSEIVNVNVTNLCLAKSGDLNADNSILLPDVVILVSYLYRAGAAPSPLCIGDVNADGNINLADIIYLTNFVFRAGPAPLNSVECCL
ncbi:MAG TPA: SBBP repeat-containing protein, partial [candidate division Zixibacteria bacterium]|nr:SBBP repeat-containing protein [candidate division Zixibacteria bacterium]